LHHLILAGPKEGKLFYVANLNMAHLQKKVAVKTSDTIVILNFGLTAKPNNHHGDD